MGKSTISMVKLHHQPVMIFPYLSKFSAWTLQFPPKENLTFFPIISAHNPQRCRIFGPATARDGWPQPGRMGSIFLVKIAEVGMSWDDSIPDIWSIYGPYLVNIWWFWSLAALIFGMGPIPMEEWSFSKNAGDVFIGQWGPCFTTGDSPKIPSGKRTKNYGKSPSFIGKSTFSMDISMGYFL